MKKLLPIAAILGVSSLALSACSSEDTSEATDNTSITVGSHQVGTSYHNVATALSATLSNHTDHAATVQPYAGPNAWMPSLRSGDVNFGLLSAVDASWAYTGGPGYDEPVEEARLVTNGATQTYIGIASVDGAGITTTAGVEGNRVGSDYGGNIFANEIVAAQLNSVGLDWDSVTQVPVPDAAGGLDAMRNRQADASTGVTPTTPGLVDLNSAMQVIPLPFGDLEPADIEDGVPEDMQAILEEYIPGSSLTVVPAGTGVVEEDVVAVAFDVQMISTEDVDAALVSEVIAAVWEHHEELHDSHALGEWVPENMVPVEFGVPYHEGAIEFYEAEGVWTDEHDARQQELLAN